MKYCSVQTYYFENKLKTRKKGCIVVLVNKYYTIRKKFYVRNVAK